MAQDKGRIAELESLISRYQESYYNGEGEVSDADKAVIDRYHSRSEHKRRPISTFENP